MNHKGFDELIVFDGCEPCPYIRDRVARMPLRLPTRKLTGREFDAQLEAGDRRSGVYLYRTACPTCEACEPIRIPVHEFQPSRTMRRVLKRGDRELRVEIGFPVVDQARVELFNLHRAERGLRHDGLEIDAHGYQAFLTDSCCETFEFRYFHQDELAAVSICDRGETSLSAVYCCFNPNLDKLSLGVYSVLKQIEFCQQRRLKYLYLGLFIAESMHMLYKARYRPHERLIDGQWRRFE